MPMPMAIALMTRTRLSAVKSPSSCCIGSDSPSSSFASPSRRTSPPDAAASIPFHRPAARASRRGAPARRGGSSSTVATRRCCAVRGVLRSRLRPRAVSASSARRASPGAVPRSIRRARTSRATTADTELWWVRVRSARSLSDSRGASASVCSTNNWAPLTPARCSAARDDSRSPWTIRRKASSTARVSRP